MIERSSMQVHIHARCSHVKIVSKSGFYSQFWLLKSKGIRIFKNAIIDLFIEQF